jgi:signal transduction histidine kinase
VAPAHTGTAAARAVPAPRRSTLWGTGAAGLLACSAAVALALTSPDLSRPAARSVLVCWTTLPYLASGLVAWHRRPASRFGPLMVAAGFATCASSLQWADAALPSTVGQLFDLLPAALFLHVFLAFPTGRLPGRPERLLVGVGYLAAVGLQVVVLLLGGFDEHDVLAVTSQPRSAEVVQDAALLTLAVTALGGVAVLVRRRVVQGPARRRSRGWVADACGGALVTLAVLLVAGALQWPVFEAVRLFTFAAVGLAPLAFLAALLDARLARSGAGDLLVELRADPATDLQAPLSRALRDPSLRVAYWLPQYGAWADARGRPVALADGRPGRATTVIERDGAPVAALLHEASLSDERELLDAVTAAAGIALENSRLQAELRAQLEELHSSRLRVLTAGQRERQRLERDLHDGAQQRLVGLGLELGLLQQRVGADPEARAQVESARRGVSTALAELRDLARGLHPAVLTAHGLQVALESVAARTPLPLQLSVAVPERLPGPVEVGAYYVVCECLTNVGRHAGAATASVDVHVAGGLLVVEVADDGVGGADPDRGSGLRGLADRVEALGGRLRVWTPAGHGTRVRAEIPCA